MKVNEQARQQLLDEVNGLSDEDLNKKPAPDQWSIKQLLEHLYLMEATITKTIKKQLAFGEVVSTDEKPIEFTVRRGTKVDAPAYVFPSEEYSTLAALKEKLAATHKGLFEIANNTADEKLQEKAFPHPAFGQLNLKQWIPFVGYHEMRHIEQIREVKASLGLK